MWFVFACLASRITYWLWRVEGDGFHVTREFVESLPFSSSLLAREDMDALVSAATRLWQSMSGRLVESVNRGRKTVTHRPPEESVDLDMIDSILSEGTEVGGAAAFCREFLERTVAAGREDETKPVGHTPLEQEEATQCEPPSGDVEDLNDRRHRSRLTKEEWREFTKNVWQIANVADREHPAAFPVEIPRRLIKLFSWVDETVLDPFAGTGTTGLAAAELGRRCVCVDSNARYVTKIKERLASFDGRVRVECADSRELGFLDDESVSLVVTSPPYWNKADYGGGAGDIGAVDTYHGFLVALRPVFEECFRVLAAGRKLCVVTANVNQYTECGLLTFPLPADMGNVLRDIGFVMVGDVIWNKDGTGGKWGSWGAQRPIFGSYPYPPNFYFKNVHEHILVFAKPPSKLIKMRCDVNSGHQTLHAATGNPA